MGKLQLSVCAFVEAIERNNIRITNLISFAIGKAVSKEIFLIFVGVVSRCLEWIKNNLALVFDDDAICSFVGIFLPPSVCRNGF